MSQSSVVLALTNARSAEVLAVALHSHFDSVAVVHAQEHVRPALLKFRAGVAILDLEMISLSELEALHRDLPHVLLICTHRVPDDEMWAAALAAGAVDCFLTSDVRHIVTLAAQPPGPQPTENVA